MSEAGGSKAEPAAEYFKAARETLEKLELEQVYAAAALIEDSLGSGGLVHVFGAGHSLLLALEVFFRAGGLVAVNPVLDKRMQFFEEGVVRTTEFERSPDAAKDLAAAAGFAAGDTGVIISNSGRNALPVEVAFCMRNAGMKVIALTNLRQSGSGPSLHSSGKRLFECADAVLDNHCPMGDAAVTVPGLAAPMGPLSTVTGATLLHAALLQAAAQLARKGMAPGVFGSVNVGKGSLEGLTSLIAPYEGRIRFYRTRGNAGAART